VSLPEPERELVVAAKEVVADDVVALELRDPADAPLPPWTAGAHIDVVLDRRLLRQYSLYGSPDEARAWRIAVLREPQGRGGSAWIHDALAVGDLVGAVGPRNHFPLVKADRYAFVAGGIGITPILPMITAAARAGADWRLLYGGRKRGSMAFCDLLAQHGERVRLQPEDEQGLLDVAAFVGAPERRHAIYCCGPGRLLDAVEALAEGWAAGVLHVERFAPVAPKAGDDDGMLETFEVMLERSQITLAIPPGKSILDACDEAGVPVVSSCREGTCGTCEVSVLDGVPHHRDSVLDPEERESGDMMMICVSRSRTPRLVLDL
jgi:ferredoxin-NADP reductase